MGIVFGLKLANVYPGNVAFRQFVRIKLATYDPTQNNSAVSNTDNTAGGSQNTSTSSSSSAIDAGKTATTTQQQQLQILSRRSPQPETTSTRNNKGSRSLFLDGIVEELTTIRKSKFYLYDKDNCWYRHIVNSAELRKRIAQFVRDEKKRMKVSGMAALLSTNTRGGHNSSTSSRGIRREASGRSQRSVAEGLSVLTDPTSLILNKNNSNDDDESNIMDIDSPGASMLGVDPKRFKKDDSDCRNRFVRGGGCV